MPKKPSAKKLTFLYFSIVAIALVTIHAMVFELTLSDLEYVYAEKRLAKVEDFAKQHMTDKNLRGDQIEIPLYHSAEFLTNPIVYLNFEALPNYLPNPNTLQLNESYEIRNGKHNTAFFAKKILIDNSGKLKQALLVIDNSDFEESEEQLLPLHTKQIAISLLLLIFSLLVVLKISGVLTKPISELANKLAERSPNDLSKLTLNQQVDTLELQKLLDTLHIYQEKIHQLINRERAFNRYTSHELRTPIMIMQGAITLLAQSQDPIFVERQRQRLQVACTQISEFIETLLSLTKTLAPEERLPREISKSQLQAILDSHQHLLTNDSIALQIIIEQPLSVRMPTSMFFILLANVVKNAFASTEQGQITLVANAQCIKVIDSGKGLPSSSNNSNLSHQAPTRSDIPEGFGLGLLLVRDICQRYNYRFELTNNLNTTGCTATIDLDETLDPDSRFNQNTP